jgi:hypothetical protein
LAAILLLLGFAPLRRARADKTGFSISFAMVCGTRSGTLPQSRQLRTRKVTVNRVVIDLRWLKLDQMEETRLLEDTQVFGYGPQICLAREYVRFGSRTDHESMAPMELRMLLAAMILNYTWSGVMGW